MVLTGVEMYVFLKIYTLYINTLLKQVTQMIQCLK